MKIYLSGKITGDANYRQKFGSMEEELLSYGYVVFNPAILPDGFEYEEAKCLGLRILTEADFKMRRTLLQLCRDSKRLAEIEQDDNASKTLADKIIQLSDNVEKKIGCFIPHLSEEENLLQVYGEFDPELKKFFIEEFISDSDKQIEYDMIERLSGSEFDEKVKLAQMYSTTAELVELFKGKIDKAA